MKIYNKALTFIFFASIVASCQTNAQTANGKECASTYDSTLERYVYTFVDEMPQYPGGEAKFSEFILKNFSYPGEQEDLQSKIILTFIIEPDGSMSNVDVAKKNMSNRSLVDEEAIRVFRLMPPWTAGKCNGNTIAVKMVLPIYIHPR